MKNLILLLLVTLSLGCKWDTMVWVCNCEEKKRAQEFIGSHIRDSNDMRGEGMEDVVKALTRAAIMINCHQEVAQTRNGSWEAIDWKTQRLDSCRSVYPDYLLP